MSHDFEALFGQVVGSGAQATVYAKGEYAVKLYREGYPKGNVFSEAYIMANLERENFPSPKVYEVLFVNGRYGIRMDRARGKTMSEGLADPSTCTETLNTLVDLQCRLQKQGNAGQWAPDIKARFRNDLMRNDSLSPGGRERLLGMLGQLPDGQALCHCDFHSGNVFYDGAEYTIIDLLQICRGDPAADAACSYVAYSLLDQKLAARYLNRYREISGIPSKHVLRWVPVYAGTMLGQMPEAYARIIERFLNDQEGS